MHRQPDMFGISLSPFVKLLNGGVKSSKKMPLQDIGVF